ncbi:ABC transporter substrate-binding protein [Metabacillus arenae]|uniref:Sugar ABC transporter substrate-binding protein n=1 Tax=Metabacillus arenae TaxID=2771434 RepID=A0A926NK49_9BACI|nr:sugar ABC transporter substrate-binding protein [Metabacillus arenae]MBD1382245.1 sugar ABC transporter substrate-binding protein [Metabacillus arenae]
MKKFFACFFALFLLIGVLSACNQSTGTTEQEEKSGSGSVDLKVAVFPADLPTFEKVYEDFKEKNPNINIKFDSFPMEQYYEKVRLQLSSGEGYDLVAGQIDSLVDTGIAEPLNDRIKESSIDISGFGPMYDAMKVNGDVVGLPYRKSNWMLYYNKDLFDEKGIEYPSDDMTWADFRELAKKMTSGQGENKVYGAYIQQWPQTWYMQAVQNGSTIVDKDLSPFKDALQYRIDLEKDGSIMKWSEQVSTGAHYNAAFQKGNVAMNLIGDWHVVQLRQAEEEGKISFDWDVVPIPHPEGVAKNTSLALPVSLILNKNSKAKDEAFEFLSYITGKEGAVKFASDGYLTGYMDEEVKKAYAGDGSLKPENAHYFFETKEYPEYPMIPGVRSIVLSQIYQEEGELALLGEQSVDKAIDNIEKRVKDEWASKYDGKYEVGK